MPVPSGRRVNRGPIVKESTEELSPEDILERSEDLPEVEPADGAAVTAESPSETVEPAPYVGSYRLLARFPSSSAGDVFLGVRRTEFGYARRAVLKVVWARRSGYDDRRRALLDEARAVAALDHPNIVKMLDCGGGDYGTYLALEFVDGLDLLRVIMELAKKGRRLPYPVAMFIVAEIMRGLSHAHDAKDASGAALNLVHRDANPSNILIARTGHAVLTDFGIVRMRERFQADTAPALVKGKFRYLAPEYIMNREVDRRVDIYSMGVVLFECLFGGPWTEPRSAAAVHKIVDVGIPVEDLDELDIPPRVQELVACAVARDPNHRFASAGDMADALETFLIEDGVYVSPARVASFLVPLDVFSVLRTDVPRPPPPPPPRTDPAGVAATPADGPSSRSH